MKNTTPVQAGGSWHAPQPASLIRNTSKRLSHLWPRCLGITLGSFLLTLVFTVTSPAQVVTVDCATRLDEYGPGQDDIARLRGYFDTATLLPETGPILRETRWRMDQLKANSFRSIGDEDNSQLDASGNFLPSSAFKAALDRYKDQVMSKPHIVVALNRPPHMVAPFVPNDIATWTAADWNKYEDYCYKLIRHVMINYRGGWQEVRFEITNEAEASPTGTIWSAAGVWGNGDRHMYEGFFKIYREWAQAAQRVASETGKNPMVMGPVTGIGSFLYWPESPWYSWFLDDVAAEGLRLDAFTIHFYGPNDPIGSHEDYYENRIRFDDMVTIFRNKLAAIGRPNTPIQVTEWGPCDWFYRTDLVTAVNATPVGGAWTAEMLRQMLTSKIDDATLLLFRENNGLPWNLIGPVATFNNVTYPKPAFNVMRMFSALPGERKAVSLSSWDPDLKAIASAGNGQIGILVSNYDFDAEDIIDKSQPHSFGVTLTNPSLTGLQTVRRYVVDANNSNVSKFLPLAAGTLAPIQECELRLVDVFNVNFSGGSITLPNRTIEKSGVSLWLIGGGALREGELVGDYTIKNVDTGKFLDIAGTSSGSSIVHQPPSGALSQVWTLTDIGGGYYKIVNKSTNMAFTVQNGSTSDGTPLVQQSYSGAQHQIFVVRQSDNGIDYRIIASHSGRIIENSSNPNNGMPATQWPFTDAQPAHQRWTLKSTAEVRLEAESGTLGNGAVVSPNGGASGGSAVGSMHNAGAFVQLSGIANPNPTGLSKIDIVYASGDVIPPQISVYLNGSATATATLTCPGTSSWSSTTGVVSLSVPLASSNTIKLVGGQGGIDIDYVKVSPTK